MEDDSVAVLLEPGYTQGIRLKVQGLRFKSSKLKVDGLVKSQNLDGFEKCSRSRRANPEE